MPIRRSACVFDLDGTLNHAAPVRGGLPIQGRIQDSFLSPAVLERLVCLSRQADIIIATGRSGATVRDFKTHFDRAGVRVAGWILEHGALVRGRQEWTRTVLRDIDLETTRAEIEQIIRKRKLPIDTERYRHDHEAIILLSGKGELLAEYFIDCIAEILGNRFRTIAGRRKIALIPRSGDKSEAFQANFGTTHIMTFAAGDQPDDLSLLRQAAFPLAPSGASPLVRDYAASRGGFVANADGHAGTVEVLDTILSRISARSPGLPTPGPRLPAEETETFRPSRRAYLDRLFSRAAPPAAMPDTGYLQRLASQLRDGEGMVLEVRMRDWGGEVKPLLGLLGAAVPLLPHARWRLVFRPERLGTENLRQFGAISEKLSEFVALPDGSPRFSAPGVPESPPDPAHTSACLLLYDHPEDLAPWYALAMTRLITHHPHTPRTWFLNPMYLKISGTCGIPAVRKARAESIRLAGSRVMMGANLIGPTDIRIATEGFRRLRQAGVADALILAPRVVTNPKRNRMIREAVRSVGEIAVRLSALGQGDRPRVLFVDTYNDLPALYSLCRVTYLGGGFNPRKRGFDPMESLAKGVPVILGPLYDYNRIVAEGLSGTGWITILRDAAEAASDFADTAGRLLTTSVPEPEALSRFLGARRSDPLRVTAEILADLAGESGNGYLFRENESIPRDGLKAEDLW